MGQRLRGDHTELPGGQGRVPRSSASLAQEWARTLATTAYVRMSLPDIHRDLQDLTERLVGALSGPSVDTQAASDVEPGWRPGASPARRACPAPSSF